MWGTGENSEWLVSAGRIVLCPWLPAVFCSGCALVCVKMCSWILTLVAQPTHVPPSHGALSLLVQSRSFQASNQPSKPQGTAHEYVYAPFSNHFFLLAGACPNPRLVEGFLSPRSFHSGWGSPCGSCPHLKLSHQGTKFRNFPSLSFGP